MINFIKMRNFFLEKAVTREWDEYPKLGRKYLQKHLVNDSNKNIEIFHISIIISNNPSSRGKQGFCRNSSAVNTTCYSSKVSRLYFTYLLGCLQLSVTSDPRGWKPYSGL